MLEKKPLARVLNAVVKFIIHLNKLVLFVVDLFMSFDSFFRDGLKCM